MTLVVTTVSRWGVTVVGDRAETNEDLGPMNAYALPNARKVFFAKKARVSFAIWGDARWPDADYHKWFANELLPTAEDKVSVRDIAQHVCDEVNAGMRKLPFVLDELRRGVHVAGYVDDIPHLYHCHMGHNPNSPQTELRVYADYPEIHGGGLEKYAALLKSGTRFPLRNGRQDLYNLVGRGLEKLLNTFPQVYGLTLPQPSLTGQLNYDIALVKVAAAFLLAAGKVPTVSDTVDWYAFDAEGMFRSSDQANLTIGSKLGSPVAEHSRGVSRTATPLEFDLRTSADRRPEDYPSS